MRKLIGITVAIAALATSGLAVAHQFDSRSIKAVSATFTATTAGDVSSRTCTATDGTYTVTRATYTGTSTSTEPSLNGPVTIFAESVVNGTTNVGTVTGKMQIGSGDSGKNTHFETVLTNGNAAGIAEGDHLLGNLSAGFTAAGGFTNGKIGGGASGGDAVLVSHGDCQAAQTPKPERVRVNGAITAVSSTSISAAGVTCVVPTELQSKVATLHVGDRVELTCTVANGANTLASVGGSGKGDEHSKTVVKLFRR